MTSKAQKRGVDTLLTTHGKALQTGEEIRFVLIKGPSMSLVPDPVNPKAPPETFPLVAKFGESVVKPHLQKAPWNTARLYQQDIPKAEDDSDEEAAAATGKPIVKKRWRPRKEIPKRQWILQDQVEFLETMMAKRQQRLTSQDPSSSSNATTSSRYEGIPEYNASQYCLLEQPTFPQAMEDGQEAPSIQVTLLPTTNATVAFSQPKARKSLSMSEAEMAIQDQRGKMTRFMMHDKQQLLHGTKAPTNESRKRLFGRLAAVAKRASANEEEEAEDDIMGDLAFRNRKGGGRARKELLNSLGDSGIKVDADGVLGGNNDGEFGKGQRFGRFKAEQQASDANGGTNARDEDGQVRKGGQGSTRGNDGLAMADDFYQRDVSAEYEELDYDANEQFDDDDVDVGETEVVVEGSGFADDEDDEDLDDDEINGDRPSGAEGLASLAGFRLLLAKARGEITPEQAAEAAEAAKTKQEQQDARAADDHSKKRKRNEEDDHLAQLMAAAERTRQEQAKKQQEEAEAAAKKAADEAEQQQQAAKRSKLEEDATGVQVDENGLRMITLKAVQKEIWLRHGAIPMKRLMKIFETKKDKDRKEKFREIVKELCIMQKDPVDGLMLILKQHYSNM